MRNEYDHVGDRTPHVLRQGSDTRRLSRAAALDATRGSADYLCNKETKATHIPKAVAAWKCTYAPLQRVPSAHYASSNPWAHNERRGKDLSSLRVNRTTNLETKSKQRPEAC